MKKPSSSSSSSVEVITNLDLLSEILSHVPAGSLMRLQLVSKQWLSLITSKTFSLIHRHQRSTTAAIFMQINYILYRPPYNTKHTAYRRLDLNPLENSRLDKSPFRSSAFHHDDDVLILQSCHGLLLCRTGGTMVNRYNQPNSGHVLYYYYVYNPTTNRVATIDGQWHPETTIASVLCFNPDESPHYRVVFFTKHNRRRQMQCLVYSSQHGTWKSSKEQYPFVPPFVRGFDKFMQKYVYLKGCIYWTLKSRFKTEILYYNVDEDVFGTLPWPGILPKYKKRSVYFAESASHLHLVETCPGNAATSLDVYELNSHHSGWFVKYRVDLTQLSTYFSGTMNNIGNYMHTSSDRYAFQVLTLVRREHFGEDSLLVLEIPGPGQYIVYNLIDETWKVIWQNLPGDPKILFSGNDRAIDFIESLAYV